MLKKYTYLQSVFNNELRQIFAYAVDFWVNFFGKMFAQVLGAFFLWGSIYRYNKTDMMSGYSFKGIIIYFTIAPLILRVLQGSNVGFISREIYEGGLTKYLLYPVNYFYFKLTSYIAHSFIYLLQLLIVYFFIYFFIGFPEEFSLSFMSITQGISAAILGSLLYFSMASILEMVSFWADNIWSLLVILRFTVSFLGGAFIPLSFFPESFASLIKLSPFIYLIDFPVNAFLGKIDSNHYFLGMGIMILWFIFFSFCSFKLFKKGNLKYTGVGI